MTTVVYVGNFAVSHSTETHYARSFEANGCEVTRLQEDDPGSWHDVMGDMLLYTRTWDHPAARALINVYRAAGLPTAAVHLDIWRGLARSGEVQDHSMFECDFVFTADGEEPEQWGMINHRWLRPGVVADECYLAEPDPEWADRWSVAFVGSYGYHPEWPWRPALIDALSARYGSRFVHVGGDGWPHNGHAVRGHDLNRLYASVPVVVGDSIFAHKSGRYWSDRAYEAPGRGAFQVFPRIDRLSDEIGGATYEAGDLADVFDKVDWYLRNPEVREKLRLEVHDRVAAKCTYTQRAAEILSVVRP